MIRIPEIKKKNSINLDLSASIYSKFLYQIIYLKNIKICMNLSNFFIQF